MTIGRCAGAENSIGAAHYMKMTTTVEKYIKIEITVWNLMGLIVSDLAVGFGDHRCR